MTKQVYLVDLIGVHTGMHYYHNAFCELFDKNGDVEIGVLSNYDHQSHRAFSPYLFNGNMVSKALKLLFAFVKLALFLSIHRRSLSISVEKFPPVSVQKFPLCLGYLHCF